MRIDSTCRTITALSTLAVLLAMGIATASPAQAAPIHNRMLVKIAGRSVTLDEWNLTSKTTPYNIDCHATSMWARYRYAAFRPGSTDRYLVKDVNPLRTYYINEYFWAKTRTYASVDAFTADFDRLLRTGSEIVKTRIGYYCLRDARRDETRIALEKYVDNIDYYVKRLTDRSTDLSTLDLSTDEITTPHPFAKAFTVEGSPERGYTAEVDDKADGYV